MTIHQKREYPFLVFVAFLVSFFVGGCSENPDSKQHLRSGKYLLTIKWVKHGVFSDKLVMIFDLNDHVVELDVKDNRYILYWPVKQAIASGGLYKNNVDGKVNEEYLSAFVDPAKLDWIKNEVSGKAFSATEASGVVSLKIRYTINNKQEDIVIIGNYSIKRAK